MAALQQLMKADATRPAGSPSSLAKVLGTPERKGVPPQKGAPARAPQPPNDAATDYLRQLIKDDPKLLSSIIKNWIDPK